LSLAQPGANPAALTLPASSLHRRAPHMVIVPFMRRLARAAAFGLSLSAVPVAGTCQQLPLWEVGFGAAAVDFPDYPGSDERSTYVLPLPYVVYRGEILRLDREGLRGLLVQSDRVEFDLSANASIPVKSENNAARRGMPDLDPTVQIGPSVNISLLGNRHSRSELQLQLPVRFVFATDIKYVQDQGMVFEPRLNLDVRNYRGGTGWRFGASAGPVFATQRYNAYFYSVPAAFATASRPAYEPRGGYAGLQATLSLSHTSRHWWAGAFVRYNQLDGAAFADSPLIRQESGVSAGVAAAWLFKRSSEMVEDRW